MPGKHNAGGCKCCGEVCWPCPVPKGIAISIPGFSAICGGCDFGSGTYLRAAAFVDNLEQLASGSGIDGCTAFWRVQEKCCAEETESSATIYYKLWNFLLTIGVSSGSPYATITVQYQLHRFDLSDPGGGGPAPVDPCDVEVPLATETGEVIDGWYITRYAIGGNTTFYSQIFTGGCPTVDTVLPFFSEPFPGDALCPTNDVTATLLMV